MLEIRSLVKSFGRKAVLRGVDLTVAPGETVVMFGPNGAGKTTLMRIISTLSKPTAGKVRVGGIEISYAPDAVRQQLGFVTHAPLLYDSLTAEENLRFFGRLYRLNDLDARIDALLRQVGLAARRHDPVRTYSRGMVQRLSIARALLHDPPMLLLDEPDTGLDQHAAAMLHRVVAEVAGVRQNGEGEGKRASVLLTTHNLERGLAWADRLVILAGGRVAFEARRGDLTEESLRETYDRIVGERG
ncbi:MAG: heme ABC exporter ATP-binding protein CcmA [Anaerolineae bacterium]|nr:heme ABC exporter ATP-binding protein CcmA [Anaerolineae bacterium]